MSGHIFKSTGRISAPDAVRVRDEIIFKLSEKYPDVKVIKIGSVGKKSMDKDHGDIDLALLCYDFDKLVEIINNTFPELEKRPLQGSRHYLYSVAYPYKSDDGSDKSVQADFMLSRNEEYTKFRYRCPDYSKGESNYKVYARILLFNVIMNDCAQVAWRYSLSPIGLLIKHVSGEESCLENVNGIIRMVFEEPITADDFNSVESLWKALHSDAFRYPNKLREIEKNFFIHAYTQPWEEMNISPYNFELSCWKPEELETEMHRFDYLNEINMRLFNEQSV